MLKKAVNPILKKIKGIKPEYLLDLEGMEITEDLDDFYNLVKPMFMKCNDCVLHTSRTQVVAPDGIPRSDIMIVLEGPGFLEDRTGVPLVGPLELRGSRCATCANSDKCFHDKILSRPYGWKKKKLGIADCDEKQTGAITLPDTVYLHSTGSIIDGMLINEWKFAYPRHNWVAQYNEAHPTKPWPMKSPFFVTNAVLCRAADPLTGKDARPKRTHWEACRKWLTYQWVACDPKIIVCFGRSALATILGNETAALRQKPNEIVVTKFGPVIFNNHPAFFMREENRQIRGLGYAKLKRTFEMALQYAGYPI